jgi:hypothetical protein
MCKEGPFYPAIERTAFGFSAHQLSRKVLSTLDRLGCLSFRSALASICRIRSRVTEDCWPTCFSVWSLLMPMPKRMRTMRSSRGVSEAKTRVVVSRRFDRFTASIGRIVFWSSIKSSRLESPLFADRCFESERLLGYLQNLAYFFERHAELLGELFRRRFTTDLVEYLARGPHDLVDRLDQKTVRQ